MMREFFIRAGGLLFVVASLVPVDRAAAALPSGTQSTIGGIGVGEILERLGAKMEGAVTLERLAEYAGHFDRIDLDGDGRHSSEEFIDKGAYMTVNARRGIFGAADVDRDGSVSKAEYQLNRIITDEGKAIMQTMDENHDGAIQASEFGKNALERLGDEKLCDQVFRALDSDADGEVRVPEYLRVWGQWARSGKPPAAQRIAARESELRQAADGGESPGASPKPAGGRPPSGPPSVERVFGRFDTDRDGKLSKAEVPEAAAQFILPADSNEDGFVTQEELRNHRKSARR